jgi:hypothetical protein
MHADADTNQRLSQLIAKIEIEQNPRMISVLVEELNRLLDSDKPVQAQLTHKPEPPSGNYKKTLAVDDGAIP